MTAGTTARYDGLADWYDERYVAGPALTLEHITEPDAAGVPYSLAVRARRNS